MAVAGAAQEGFDDLWCGVGDGGVEGGLPHRGVPYDLNVEHGEQPGLQVWR